MVHPKMYRALSKRLLHELAYFLDADHTDEDIGFLGEEDPAFRAFRIGFTMLQRDGAKPSRHCIEVMARILRCHADYFDTPLTEVDDKDI